MAQPPSSSVHVDYALTNMSVAYMQDESTYISTKIFPVVASEHQSNKYYVYTKNDWFRDEAQVRGEGEESAGSGYTVSTNSFNCPVYSVHKDVPDQVLQNADAAIRPLYDATEFVTQRLLLRQERQWASDF